MTLKQRLLAERWDHHSRILLTDSDKKAIVDFVKEYEELYDKSSEHFKDKARKEYLWEQVTKRCKQSVKQLTKIPKAFPQT